MNIQAIEQKALHFVSAEEIERRVQTGLQRQGFIDFYPQL